MKGKFAIHENDIQKQNNQDFYEESKEEEYSSSDNESGIFSND